MIKPLLIEIGVEELPAVPFLKELPNIEKKWLKILEENALTCEFKFYYTPRRLVLWHNEFPMSQSDREEELYGAPISVAFKDGEATPAANGFAKKCGVSLDEVGRSTKGGKEVLYFKKVTKGVDSKSLIGDMIEQFISSLNFGKSMRWGSYDKSFIRPIRWIGAMLGDEHVPFKVYNVESKYFSYPHRTISYEPFAYDFAGDYFDKLKNGGVVLYPSERKKIILEQFKEIEKENSVNIEIDEELLAEIVAITEHPKALIGTFDEEFLRLPPEVIITSMKEHQRYFPVFKDGVVTNKFIVVSNAISDDYDLIVRGNEKVLRARLSDGLFFYDNDLRNGLAFGGLKDIVYLDGLGSVFDKVLREKNIIEYLETKYGRKLGIEIDYKNEKEIKDILNRAIMMSKSDLLSEMVYEFTELQGLMGYYYAKAANEDDLVSLAIKEQYLPDSEDSELPSNLCSSLVALSCKLDSLLALFSIDKIPTGTKDPFALRRAVNGVIKIVLNKNLEFNIKEDLKKLSANYANFDLIKLENFFLERIYQFFDANPSIIKAVVASGERDIVQLSLKIEALKSIVSSSGFKELFSTFKRVANIIKDVDTDKDIVVDKNLFEQTEENELYAEFIKKSSVDYKTYEEKLDALFGLKPQIDNFFDNVMVNHEDVSIKTNRQNLIATIYKEFKQIADIKEISI
ncbi:glycine--tRNA ligase subunit beta [Sulfurospirillum arcachonense]|uniref:glycine--tRNA ligase subunit beta n=1 Tax=Sulfurospirillum arcachonense TaxID=57666 RepID=UPI0004689DA4|nr:glycine--tRNA ligase subunit beta [Sulfurospirillum arcachonense]